MNVTIDKIEVVSFGKLKNAVVTADSGINILSAPNESGKTTLASFIKFVFYGFVNTRVQTIADNDRKLYTPWEGEVCEGNIHITADGVQYIVSRRCPPSGKEVFDITNRATGKSEFVGAIPGEVFFGVGEDVFSRTLFFRQLTLPQSKDELLADRLRNIAISADEQVGTKKALSRLSEAKNELKGKLGSGLLPKAQRERDELEEAITASADMRREIVRLNAEIKKRATTVAEAEKKLGSLDAERRNIEKYEALTRLRNIKRLEVEEETARLEYQRVSSGLKKQDEGGIEFRELFSKNTEYVAQCRDFENIKNALKNAEDDRQQLDFETAFDSNEGEDIAETVNKYKKLPKLFFISGGIAAVGGLFVFLTGAVWGLLGVVLGLILASVGGVMLGRPNSIAKEHGYETVEELENAIKNRPIIEEKIKQADLKIAELKGAYEDSRARCFRLKKELDDGIGAYIDVADGDYNSQLEHILSLSAESGEKLAVWRLKRDNLEKARDGIDIDSLTEEAKGAVMPEREKAKVDREISFYSSQVAQLSDLNRRDELDLVSYEAKCGDISAMVGKRDSLNARVDDLTVKHKAYETAMKFIESAADDMKSMVAPRISERADEYFSAATGGKYNSFEVDTKLSMSFGEDFRRSCDYLSAGTRDSAYLSLRLALADILFGGCGVPIMLDDAFVRMDDTRLRMISGAISEASKKHQIFILTHGNRERDALDEMGIEYTDIKIKNIN